VCSGLPTGNPKALNFWGAADKLPPPASFQLSVKQGGPAFRITVRPIWQLSAGRVFIDDDHAGDIEVARCQDGKQLQVLPILAGQPIDFGASFHADDINFDGYLDFSVLTEFAGKFKSRSYWVYDPGSGLFVENELTRELSENCLGPDWHGGCWKAANIDFDQNKREIRADYIPLLGLCSPTGYRGDRYGVKDNRLILVHKEELGEDSCTLTSSDLIDGTMRVTRVQRFEPPIRISEAPPSPSPDSVSKLAGLASSVGGNLLYERALDDHQQGLFSNSRERRQVVAGQFVLSDKVQITGIRWYGYYACKIDPVGTSRTFEVWFYPDEDGLPPASQAIYGAGVKADVTKTTASVVTEPVSGVDFQVYAYTVDLPVPLTVPAGQQMWISISAEASSCEWVWNHASSADTGASVSRVSGISGFSNWTRLKDNLAFALYGQKIETVRTRP
jgi:hypothetical protein